MYIQIYIHTYVHKKKLSNTCNLVYIYIFTYIYSHVYLYIHTNILRTKRPDTRRRGATHGVPHQISGGSRCARTIQYHHICASARRDPKSRCSSTNSSVLKVRAHGSPHQMSEGSRCARNIPCRGICTSKRLDPNIYLIECKQQRVAEACVEGGCI